jgi:polysaccharide deacetylase 2 family uncharacterized protein YibQ
LLNGGMGPAAILLPEWLAGARAARALAFASAFFVCILTAGALAITLLGSRTDAGAVMLDLAAPPSPSPAPAAAPAAASLIPGAAPVTKPLYAGKALIADPALVENTPEGPLPRIAEDGRSPMQAYAAPAPVSDKPKIAIVVSGLGLSAKATEAALSGLPAAVTLGFAPYASDVGAWAAKARAAGHELLLEIPMEPFDFPDSDPGPHTLRAGQEEGANIPRLTWALTRFTGYAGVTNLLGQRFLSDSDALAPVLTYLARRGLYFFDNGNATQSVAPLVAQQAGTALVQSGVTLDTIQSALEIDRRLSELEAAARARGSAVGTAFLYPVSVARIAAWAKGLAARGFVLVPVSAILPKK